eukprot:5322514-Prorocentrum_lima.AAC.1
MRSARVSSGKPPITTSVSWSVLRSLPPARPPPPAPLGVSARSLSRASSRRECFAKAPPPSSS